MSALAAALLAELDDQALDELAKLLAPRLATHALRPPADTQEPGALSVRSAASRLGLHPRTITRAIATGALEASKPAGRWRIQPADLDAWAARPSRERRTPAPPRRARNGAGAPGPLTRALAANRTRTP